MANDAAGFMEWNSVLESEREQQKKVTVDIEALNPFLICTVCGGYLRSATALKECGHTFCKVCIYTHLARVSGTCPRCGVRLRESRPEQLTTGDPTMQSIVDKLLPQFNKDEEPLRERCMKEDAAAAASAAALSPSRAAYNSGDTGVEVSESEKRVAAGNSMRSLRFVFVELQPLRESRPGLTALGALKRPFLVMSSAARVSELSDYIAAQLETSHDIKVRLFCRGEMIAGREHNVAFVLSSVWKDKDRDMVLHYAGVESQEDDEEEEEEAFGDDDDDDDEEEEDEGRKGSKGSGAARAATRSSAAAAAADEDEED